NDSINKRNCQMNDNHSECRRTPREWHYATKHRRSISAHSYPGTSVRHEQQNQSGNESCAQSRGPLEMAFPNRLNALRRLETSNHSLPSFAGMDKETALKPFPGFVRR